MAQRVDHLLIGGGVASAVAAQTLREQGAGSILIVGRELDPPYHRPPASKSYMQGRESRADALVHPAEWYAEHEVGLLTRTSALSVDLDQRLTRLSTRDEVEFGTLMFATGAMVRRLSVEGAALQGIHYLRTLGNADTIRGDVAAAEKVVLVGGSYIACELAASLTMLGRSCTMVMLEEVTLERSFGRQAGGYFQETLQAHGVEVIGSDEVARFEGTGVGEDARVSAVVTKGGRTLPADVVVAGVGSAPDVMLARKAGLEIGPLGGVRVDSRLQTAVVGVYAAGDVAEYDSVLHGQPMRIEHEDVASEQGRTVARNMLGRDAPHQAVPYFFSDLGDWASLEYVGPAREWDEELIRGDHRDGRFTYWYLAAERVVAALTVGRPEDLVHARRLIAEGRKLGTARRVLADPDGDLSSL